RARFRSILLEPLSERESEQLIDSLLTGPLTPEARARIASTAEGNPLFLEQVLALFEEESEGEEPMVPPTIHALLASRLDRLDAAERSVLERASVVGRSFSPAAVIELSADEERAAVESRLEALVHRDLVRPEHGATGEEGFRFAHLLIREAAYESVPKRTRADLHERLADRLERVGPEPIDELVGYHLEQAHTFRRVRRVEPGPPRVLARPASSAIGSRSSPARPRRRSSRSRRARRWTSSNAPGTSACWRRPGSFSPPSRGSPAARNAPRRRSRTPSATHGPPTMHGPWLR